MSDYPAELYVPLHVGTPGDLAYYRRRCADATSVLELGCGHGRVLLELAAPGRFLVGLDHHQGLLALARRRQAALPPELVDTVLLLDEDMRSFALPQRFDRIIIPHSGLFCLLTDDDVRACFARARRHLLPGGLLLLDVYNPTAFHEECVPEDLAEDELVPVGRITTEAGREFSVLERSVWRREEQFIHATYVYRERPDDPGIEASIPQRYMLMHQMLEHLQAEGFSVDAVFGGFAGEGLEGAETLVIEARPA
ncbi:MAG: class I SAM-dependent methyltransferase [Myxococcales bacterium]|nr:class I SAM-dependent methyltransferase [Myxococcales bacterium]MCB9754854.1 class I SAM-dependent methyltransferase [Myxococcales bacterium]